MNFFYFYDFENSPSKNSSKPSETISMIKSKIQSRISYDYTKRGRDGTKICQLIGFSQQSGVCTVDRLKPRVFFRVPFLFK